MTVAVRLGRHPGLRRGRRHRRSPRPHLVEGITLEFEILVVVDDADGLHRRAVLDARRPDERVRTLVNTTGGDRRTRSVSASTAPAPVVVVTMADGSDDPRMIDPLARLVERGVVVAAASRYSPGGQQVGGPIVKGALSRTAGRTLGTSRGSAPMTRRTVSRPTPPTSCARWGSTAEAASRSGSS